MNSYSYPGLIDKRYKNKKDIITTVCNLYEIRERDLYKRTRAGIIPEARRVCIYLMRKYLRLQYEKIGNSFKLDHATAVHHVRKFEEHYEVDKSFRTKVTPIL